MAERLSLFKGHNYDSNYDYVKGFATKQDQFDYFESLQKINETDFNYVRTGQGTFRLASDNYGTYETYYDFLVGEGYNYGWINNGDKFYYFFITSKEMISENVCEINFQYDVWQTMMFDFNIQSSFVSRKVCSISEVADFDEGLEIGEPSIISEELVLNKDIDYYFVLGGFRTTEILYDASGTQQIGTATSEYSIDTPLCSLNGIEYPLNFVKVSTTSQTVKNLLKSHPSLIGIIGLPVNNTTVTSSTTVNTPFLTRDPNRTPIYQVESYNVTYLTSMTVSTVTDGLTEEVSKTNFTDFFPYTYYVVTDGESNPMVIKPQYLDSNFLLVKETIALSYKPVIRYHVPFYKGDQTGRTFNMLNNTAMFLPSGTNEGASYLLENSSAIQAQKTLNWGNATANVLQGAIPGALSGATAGGLAGTAFAGVGAIPGALIGGAVGAIGGIISGINTIVSQNARLKDVELTPNSIGSYGEPSTRNAFNTDNVRVQKWSVEQKYKDKVNSFVSRYGNKFNNYATIDHKTYKGYVQMIAPELDTNIDSQFKEILKSSLERGVYFE